MSESKVSIEVAQDQMNEFLDYYGIKQNHIETDQGPEAVKTTLNRLICAISEGHLEIQDNGAKVKQNLRFPIGDIPHIIYDELGARHKLAMDGINPNKVTARMHALMGSLAGVPASAFIKLRGQDNSIMESLAVLFMVV